MAKKVEGLTVVSRDSKRGQATYDYKGVRIEKYTRDRGYKGMTRGSYHRAGARFGFSVRVYRANAMVVSHHHSFTFDKLQDAVKSIEEYLTRNILIENGRIIVNPDERAILIERGELSA